MRAKDVWFKDLPPDEKIAAIQKIGREMFSTPNGAIFLSVLLDDLYLAAVQSVEEAVVNAMVAGEDVPTVKPPGRTCRALDHDRLREIFAATA